MWETIRGYLTFTRKERNGVLFLFLLISLFFVLPYFFKKSPGDADPAAYLRVKEDIRKFELRNADSSRTVDSHDRYPRQKILPGADSVKAAYRPVTDMFYFDPNKIGTADWLRLGLTDRLTQTIRHYLEKGGRFQKAEDLNKLYGLHRVDYNRLLPYVRIGRPTMNPKSSVRYDKKSSEHISADRKTDSFFRRDNLTHEYRLRNSKLFVVTDINLSDSSDWSKLPGIGEKLASRIIRFREKLGGFYQVDQVAETFGLPDSTFQKIKPYLRMQPYPLRQLDINTATKEILITHPYIRWQLAQAIVEYKQQHGFFQTVEDLLQLAQMDPAKFEKLKPYLVAGHQ